MALFREPADIDLSVGSTHGDGRFAEIDDVPAELLRGGGIPLGWLWSTSAAAKQGYDHWGQRLSYSGDQHLITIAPSRSGKGTTTIIPALLEYPGSMIVIDPKGQNAAVTAAHRRAMGQEVICLNPFGMHTGEPWHLPSHTYNPLSIIDEFSANFVADVNALCEALIVTEGNEPHWSNSARDLVSALILYVLADGTEERTLGRIRRLATRGHEDFDTFEAFMQHLSESPFPFVAQKAGRFTRMSDGIHGIISTATTQLNFLDDPVIVDSLKTGETTFADLKTRPVTIYLILPARYISAYSRWLRIMVVSALNELTATARVPGQLPVLFLLDEFAQLGHLKAIEDAMGMAAGYGVQLWPIFQDLNQAEQIYGKRWQTFLANAGVVQFFTPNDVTTAEYITKRAGQTTARSRAVSVREVSVGESHRGFSGASYNYNEVGVPLIEMGRLFGFDAERSILFLNGNQFPILARRFEYFRNKSYDRQFEVDPYHAAAVASVTAQANDAPKPRSHYTGDAHDS